jgi:hypothetical protein
MFAALVAAGSIFRPTRNGKMKRVTQFRMYALGYVSRLRDLKVGDQPERAFSTLYVVKAMLKQFSEDDESRKLLAGAVERSNTLQRTIESEIPRVLEAPGAVLSQTIIDDLSRQLTAFEASLGDDLGRLPTYLAEPVGAYSFGQLIDQADSVFPKGMRESGIIPPQAIAGFCVCWTLPSF